MEELPVRADETMGLGRSLWLKVFQPRSPCINATLKLAEEHGGIVQSIDEIITEFASASTIAAKWDAARKLMANQKERALATSDSGFLESISMFESLALAASGVDRLLAVDLLVRLSESLKKLRPVVLPVLTSILRSELPQLSLVSEKKQLDVPAEPADIRENVVLALTLTDASEDWVLPYVVKAFSEEGRSEKCRKSLADHIAKCEPSVEQWFAWFKQELGLAVLDNTGDTDAAVGRLKDVAESLAAAISKRRSKLQIKSSVGPALSSLVTHITPLGQREGLPKKLPQAAASLARLLDELLAVRLTLMGDEEIYAPIELIYRWWAPLPFPDEVNEALIPLVDKLVAGITFRARGGQISEPLAKRLRQALNDSSAYEAALRRIAESEVGLTSDVDDWLRGQSREKSGGGQLHSALEGVATESFIAALAPVFLLSSQLLSDSKERTSSELEIAHRVRSLGESYGLATDGGVGTRVEYHPNAHSTVDGSTPQNPLVRVIHPMVVRKRADGSRDVVLKALVGD